MSQENVDFIRRAYAEPDPLTALSQHMAPDAEFDFAAVYPDGPVLRGIIEMRRFREEGAWGRLHFEPERFIDVDAERVLVFVRVSGSGRLSGLPGEIRAAHEFTIRDGLLVRFKVYLNRAAALEAVGLSEQDTHADS